MWAGQTWHLAGRETEVNSLNNNVCHSKQAHGSYSRQHSTGSVTVWFMATRYANLDSWNIPEILTIMWSFRFMRRILKYDAYELIILVAYIRNMYCVDQVRYGTPSADILIASDITYAEEYLL